ncbi:MAG TPA: hypothetical protein VF407_17400 [Polyangiaceae bacterium]
MPPSFEDKRARFQVREEVSALWPVSVLGLFGLSSIFERGQVSVMGVGVAILAVRAIGVVSRRTRFGKPIDGTITGPVSVTDRRLLVGHNEIAKADVARGFALPPSTESGPHRVFFDAGTGCNVRLELDDGSVDMLANALDVPLRDNAPVFALAAESAESRSWWTAIAQVWVPLGGLAIVFSKDLIGRQLMGAALFAFIVLAAVLLGFREHRDRLRVVVGRDGVAFKAPFTAPRTVPLAAIVGVEVAATKKGHALVLRTDAGETLRAHAEKEETVRDAADAVRAAIRRATDEARSVPALRPVEGDVHAWLASLRAIGAGANASFRAPAVTSETLWRVVEHGATVMERVAAAVALSTSDGAAAKPRLRVLAEQVADPALARQLRVAIEADDDAALEAVLAPHLEK